MGIEYYLLKPEKKEIFYLGKHFLGFEEIPSMIYREGIEGAAYPSYEDWDDFFWDTLKTNWDYFYPCDLTLEQVSNVIHKIYEWCISDKVILDNDCSETAEIWKDWKETGNITKILEEVHNSYDDTFQDCLESYQSIIFENPNYSSALVGITTDGRAVYDYELMIRDLSLKDNMSYEEALEFIDYNTVNSLPPADNRYPIIIHKKGGTL